MTDSPQAASSDRANQPQSAASQAPETQLVPVNLPGIGDTYLDKSMAPRVEKFISEASAHGVNLHFNSAYRTPEHQAALRNDPNAITPADNSLHSAGFAVDVNYSSLPTSQQTVIRNAAAAAGLNWGGNFRSSDPPHFYIDPPVDRATAIANATKQYADEQARQSQPAQVQESTPQTPEPPSSVDTPAQRPGPETIPPEGGHPTSSLWLNNPSHPDHLLFNQAKVQTQALDQQFGRASDQQSENLAAALTVQAKAGELRGIRLLVLSDDGNRAFISDDTNDKNVFRRIAFVDVVPALQQSIEESTQKIGSVNNALAQRAQDQSLDRQLHEVSSLAMRGPAMT